MIGSVGEVKRISWFDLILLAALAKDNGKACQRPNLEPLVQNLQALRVGIKFDSTLTCVRARINTGSRRDPTKGPFGSLFY